MKGLFFMALRVAVQMDPLETINIEGDSTFAILLEALARGHALWHYQPEDLHYDEGHVRARARPIQALARVAGAHFTLGKPVTLDLAEDVDVVLMRQDPPFDLAYITATHLLEMIHPKTLVVNDPAQVRNAPEKLFVTQFQDLMPATMITRTLADVEAFRARHGEVVIKPLYGNAGAGVFHIGLNDPNVAALVEMFQKTGREAFMVQRFLPDVRLGDKRIVLIDGAPAGAINRLPRAGEIRSNLAAGGVAQETSLTEREIAICNRIGPALKERGLLFVGIDVIAGCLTEINVTSPTGLVAIDRYNGSNTPALIWQAIEKKRLPA
jgi:glutathione synthase